LLKKLGVEIEDGLIRRKIANALAKILENIQYEGPVVRFFKDILSVPEGKKEKEQ